MLTKPVFLVDAVKYLLEFIEEAEVRLAHQVEHMRFSVFRRDFQPAGDMAGNELFAVLAVGCVGFRRA